MVAVIQSSGHVRLSETQRTAAHKPSLSFIISLSMLKFMSIESVITFANSSSVIPFSSCTQSFQVFFS